MDPTVHPPSLRPMAQKKIDLLGLFVFLIPFSAYLFTAAPTLYWRDGAEFQTVGFVLGIAHPSGSPLYAIISKLFTFIPMGSIAFKVTLLSAFFGGVISYLIYRIIQAILVHISFGMTQRFNPHSIEWIAFSAGLLFSLSNALWENANVPEVYTLANAFTACFILLLVCAIGRDADSQKQFKAFSILMFLFGLSLGAHAAEIFYLPFLPVLLFFLWRRRTGSGVLKYGSILLFFFILGSSVFLYLPVRASQAPAFNWGDPQTLERFLIHVTDRKDAPVHFDVPSSQDVWIPQLINYARFFPDSFSFFGTLLGLIGLVYLFRREKKVLGIMATFFFPPFLFFIRFWWDSSNYLSGFIIFTILLGVGSGWVYLKLVDLAERSQQNLHLTKIFGVLLTANILILAPAHFIQNDKSTYWGPGKVFKRILLDLESNAIAFTRDAYFAFSYLQNAEAMRPDVTHLSSVEFVSPSFFFTVTQARFPLVTVPSTGREKLGSAFLSSNIMNHPIYWQPDPENDHLVAPYLSLDGLFFRIQETPPPLTQERIKSYLAKIKDSFDPNEIPLDSEESRFYGDAFSKMGAYFLKEGGFDIALQHFETANALSPDNVVFLNLLGVAHGQLKQVERSEEYFKRALSLDAQSLDVQRNLGILYLEEKRFREAEGALLKASMLQPKNAETNYQLGLLYEQMGKKEEAASYFERAIAASPEYRDTRERLNQLQSS
ncbi:DUF2723 domain-containing protein [Candidatus Manganitrophus noduliformans]|nr:DUF2723 domain-containing protein [Candidatus Manganitrophus noduliformans]